MQASKRPNFLVIVADDLGFSDTEPYGSEISTPALQRLAKDGLRMTNFHTAPACSPTRSMLLSGTDNHIAGLGQMAEFMMGYLNFRVAALPEILQDAGYFTLCSGKWHLGMTAETSPSSRGFNKCLSFLPGAGNHHNYEPQLDARLPPFIKSSGFWMENDKFIDRSKDLPENFYSSDYFTDRLLGFLDERTGEEKQKPFFGYLAYTAPHWPLQAPREKIAKYRGLYDDGPKALRDRRLRQLQKLHLVPKDVIPAPVDVPGAVEWSEKGEGDKATAARAMEIYAAMVDKLDDNIGRVIDHLEASGELDNTFIVFMSDIGAEGSTMESMPIMGSLGIRETLRQFYDNSYENMGNANSFIMYGPQWALAATAPSRGFKGFTTEGGIRCPCIVRYPPLVRKEGGISHSYTNVMDILPTMLDLAGVSHPGTTFRGREVVAPRGKSWVPMLSSKTSEVYGEGEDVAGWELFGMRAIRRGKYKAVMLPPPHGTGAWELYDIDSDPGETKDLAASEPGVMSQLFQDWVIYFSETGMIEYHCLTKFPALILDTETVLVVDFIHQKPMKASLPRKTIQASSEGDCTISTLRTSSI
ncbi:arylsulfatase [Colletotrichum melonis]|uniref:Arylsulfatase n=1 Tax=Colletotrichum melonis TaxID=1209925 RepID=A0AAI9UQC0_9PEZI|nr:arylsulfatase [Colletotrichum melonis]